VSKLILRGHNGAEFKLNVTQFRSPMSATINTVQTRRMSHHFPIRAGQPDIQFTVQFPSQDEKHRFQNFVRDHQLNALDDKYTSSAVSSGSVTLLWPERNIDSWTGYIVNVPVQEVRFDYAPKLTFGVMLVNSLMSEQTFGPSIGGTVDSIFGVEISAYVPDAEDLANWFQLPTVPVAQQVQEAARQTVSLTEQIVTGFGRLFGR
jgi:hypothetical protein